MESAKSATVARLTALVGEHDGEFAGPWWLRSTGPITMWLTGMPGWCGKSFRPPTSGSDVIEGTNLVRRGDQLVASIPMNARIAPSRVDGRTALIVHYPKDARFPWRNVTDELRPLDDRTLLGLSFGIPGSPPGGAPFLLRRKGRPILG
ncbi:MAG: hypothetical protein M3O76_05100 [Actinomycetota bacterium]|nr:hypothetical protein [Chloroflexota bacterium]MDP9277569.1 hypothetical protein [Actinomycetota bacterium]